MACAPTQMCMNHFFKIVFFVILPTAILAGVFYRSELLQISQPTVDLRDLRLEIADTPAKREKGLSGRAVLHNRQAMLFLFETPGIYPFWMKDTRFSLDILWLNNDVIVDMATLPATLGDAIPAIYTPTHFADRVLEVEAGTGQKKGLQRGVKVLLPAP